MQKLYEKYNGYLIEDAVAYKSRDFVNFANYAKRRMKVAANRKKTVKEIDKYKSLKCMQNALRYSRPVYEALVREM